MATLTLPSDEFESQYSSNAPRFLAQFETACRRGTYIATEMDRKGAIKKMANASSDTVWWVKVRTAQAQAIGKDPQLTYGKNNTKIKMIDSLRTVVATGRFDHTEKLLWEQGGTSRLTESRADEEANAVGEAFLEFWPTHLLGTDGNASGNEKLFCGVPTFMGVKSGQTLDAADKIVQPGDTYAGQSTELGVNGGTWGAVSAANGGLIPNAQLANNWPTGAGTYAYDANSPKIFRINTTGWTGTATWASACLTLLRFAYSTMHTTVGGMQDSQRVSFMNNDFYAPLKDALYAKFNTWSPYTPALELGFGKSGEAVLYDGVGHIAEAYSPAGQCLILDLSKIEYEYVGNFVESLGIGPLNRETMSYEVLAMMYGNFRFWPKFHAKAGYYTTGTL